MIGSDGVIRILLGDVARGGRLELLSEPTHERPHEPHMA
jgi:hypothetical protein